MIGMAARVMETTPKKFVSIKARNLSELTCSNGAVSPYPALLTKTSNRPKTSTALATAAFAAASSETSRAAVDARSPYRSTRSFNRCGSRAVASRRSPDARTASAISRPKPLALPVTNHTLDMRTSVQRILFCLVKDRVGAAAGVCRNSHSIMTKSLDFALCSVCSCGQIGQKREKRIRLASEEAHGRQELESSRGHSRRVCRADHRTCRQARADEGARF